MTPYPFDSQSRATANQTKQSSRDGVVTLTRIPNACVVAMLLDRVDTESARGTTDDFTVDSRFNRVTYDFDTAKLRIARC